MATLLESAKQHQPKRSKKYSVSAEEVELALAWVNDEITLTQASSAYGELRNSHAGHALYRLATILKQANMLGLIEVRQK